jgi:hypothetical protein
MIHIGDVSIMLEINKAEDKKTKAKTQVAEVPVTDKKNGPVENMSITEEIKNNSEEALTEPSIDETFKQYCYVWNVPISQTRDFRVVAYNARTDEEAEKEVINSEDYDLTPLEINYIQTTEPLIEIAKEQVTLDHAHLLLENNKLIKAADEVRMSKEKLSSFGITTENIEGWVAQKEDEVISRKAEVDSEYSSRAEVLAKALDDIKEEIYRVAQSTGFIIPPPVPEPEADYSGLRIIMPPDVTDKEFNSRYPKLASATKIKCPEDITNQEFSKEDWNRFKIELEGFMLTKASLALTRNGYEASTHFINGILAIAEYKGH